MNGKIAQIDRLRIDTDGPGIRTLVALHGCPLSCRFCPNGRAISGQAKMTLTAEELVSRVDVDNLYFLASGGGITFGGGEPLLQAEFISDVIKKAPREWSFAVETSLAVPFKNIKRVASLVDLFYIDIKAFDPAVYKKYTGRSKGLLNLKLKRLLKLVSKEKIVVRIPLIDGYVDGDAQKLTELRLKKMGFTNFDKFTYSTDI